MNLKKQTLIYTFLAFLILLCVSGCSFIDTHAEEKKSETQSQNCEIEESIFSANTEKAEKEPVWEESAEPIDEDLVLVRDYISDIYIELKYAESENFTGQVIYDFTDAYLRYGTVKKLADVQKNLIDYGYSLKIWDAYRPVSAQFKLWEVCPDTTYVANPKNGYSSHNKGNTVDVTIVKLNGDGVDMPTDFDDFSALADRDYSDIDEMAAKNAMLLEKIMEENGFKPYFNEWWHYSDVNDYSIINNFSNENSMWIANCSEFISMRKTASYDGEIICKIMKGESFELIEFTGAFAKIKYKGKEGFVLSNYIKAGNGGFKHELKIVEPQENYTYEQMLKEITELKNKYAHKITSETIGKSENGRDIPVIILGNKEAEYHIMIQGAIHGREHMTACILMCQIEYVISNLDHYFEEETIGNILENTCFHIIPMSNPDGVVISQTGELNEEQVLIYERDKNMGHTSLGIFEYATKWKANANGVDLNRNFDAGWDTLNTREFPSSERYKGYSAEDQSESAALAEYIKKYPFSATVSYHISGCVVYYDYGTREDIIVKSYEFAKSIETLTGYITITDGSLDAGGFKDWAIEKMGIPSITIEMGCEAAPLKFNELYSAYERNKNLFPTIAEWIKSYKN